VELVIVVIDLVFVGYRLLIVVLVAKFVSSAVRVVVLVELVIVGIDHGVVGFRLLTVVVVSSFVDFVVIVAIFVVSLV